MKKSNIFVHIELSKMITELCTDTSTIKNKLKSQAGYFNIIDSKYFSDSLSVEWEQITREIKDRGPKTDSDGRIVANAVINTIEQMSAEQCISLVSRIMTLHQKVKLEFD